MNHTATIDATLPFHHEYSPNSKGTVPLYEGTSVSSSKSSLRFFKSERFHLLCDNAYNLGALHRNTDNQSHTEIYAPSTFPPLEQFVLDADTNHEQYLIPGSTNEDRHRLVEAWSSRVIRIVPTPKIHTPQEWLIHTINLEATIGHSSASRFTVQVATLITRDFVTQPNRWGFSGLAVLCSTRQSQELFVKAITQQFASLFAKLYVSDMSMVNRLSSELAQGITKEVYSLPSVIWSACGDKRLSTSDVAGRIVMHVTLPLTTNILLLTPPSTLIAIGLTTGAVTSLLAISPLGEALLGETIARHTGQLGSTAILTGSTALMSQIACQMITGIPFSAGTLQFQVASHLTTQVARSMITNMTQGKLVSASHGPQVFKLILDEAQRHFVFLKFRYHAREATRMVGARIRSVYSRTWGKHIDPHLPPSLHFLSASMVASFATAWGLWFAYVCVPFHLDALQYECQQWVKPLQESLIRLMPWLANVPASKITTPIGIAYRLVTPAVYHQIWQPFITHILQDHLALPERASSAVNSILKTCKRRYPWLKAVLTCKPFARVVQRELLQRWYLDYLFNLSVEHLFVHSPLSAFLSIATDAQYGNPQTIVKCLVSDAAAPFVRSMRAIYDARIDAYTGVRLAFLGAVSPSTESNTEVTEPAQTTDDLLNRLALAAERIQSTTAPQAYAQLHDAWMDYQDAFGDTQTEHHPDTTADTRRRAAFARLTKEAYSDDTNIPLPPWIRPTEAEHNKRRSNDAFIQDCHRLIRDLKYGVRQEMQRRDNQQRHDLETYRRNTELDTKRAYLKEIEYMRNVMQAKISGPQVTAQQNDLNAQFVTDVELYEDVRMEDLRRMAYGYHETMKAVIAWQSVEQDMQHMSQIPNAFPIPDGLRERILRTNQYAQRLLCPFENAVEAKQRLWVGIKTYEDDLSTLGALTISTETLVSDYRRRHLVYQAYVSKFGETNRPDNPSDSEWSKMETMVYGIDIERNGLMHPDMQTAVLETQAKQPIPVNDMYRLLRKHDAATAKRIKDLERTRRSEWQQRGRQYKKAIRDWDQVLRTRYDKREDVVQRLAELQRADLSSYAPFLQDLTQTLQRRISDGAIRMDATSRSASHTFMKPDANTVVDLTAWVAANDVGISTLETYEKVQSIIDSLPSSAELTLLRRHMQLDNDVEGLEAFDAKVHRIQEDGRRLQKALDDLTALRKVAFWQSATQELADLQHHVPLETRGMWPFSKTTWNEWHSQTASQYRKSLDEHIQRIKQTDLPIEPHTFETMDVVGNKGGWATLLEAVESSSSKSETEMKAAIRYVRALGQRERQFRAYVDASFDTKLSNILQPENGLSIETDAGELRHHMREELLNVRNELAPYHAEQEGYVHPLLQRLSEWTDTRYSIHDERRQLQKILHDYVRDAHQHDVYSRQRALQKAQHALEKRLKAWSVRKPVPPSITTHRPDLPKTGQSTTTGDTKTSRNHHIEQKLHAVIQAEERIWDRELQQLKDALDLANELGQVATNTDNTQTIPLKCNEWEAVLLKLSRTEDGLRLANAIRPQLVALKATGSVYSQLDSMEKKLSEWQNQIDKVYAHSHKTSSFVNEYIIKPLASLNPFAPSVNQDIRTLAQRTATVDECIKQFHMNYRHQSKTFSDAHRSRIEQRWDTLTQSHSAAWKHAWSQMNKSFEKTNREFEASVYSHGFDSSHSRTLNERRQLLYTIVKRLDSLQHPGRQPRAFETDARVVQTNLRVKQHENMIHIRDTASRLPWTEETLLKQKQIWEAYERDSNVHEATTLAAKTAYLTGRASLLSNAYAHVEHAVEESLSSGGHVPKQLATPEYQTAVNTYNHYRQTFPYTTESLLDEIGTKFAHLNDFVDQWPIRWQAVHDASVRKERNAWVKHSKALVSGAPEELRPYVRARVEQRRPPPVKPIDTSEEAIVQPKPTYPSAWSWPWWKPAESGPAESEPTKPVETDMVHSLEEQQRAWEAFVNHNEDIRVDTNRPEDQRTYQQLNTLKDRVDSLRKLSAHYDRLYERATVEQRRLNAATAVRKAQHRYLQEAEAEYATVENELATHWKGVETSFLDKQKALQTNVHNSKIHDVHQRFTADERVHRFNDIVTSTQYEHAYRKAAQVPPVSVGKLGSPLRRVTDSLRKHAVHSHSPESMLEQLPRETYSPPGEIADYLVKTDMLRRFGELDTTTSKEIGRMDKERHHEDVVKLPKEYQTTQGLQQMLMTHLHVGAPGSTLDKNTFLKRFDQTLPFYGFKAEFEALAVSHAFRVALIVDQSPPMMKMLGLQEDTTTLDIANTIWKSPTSVKKLDRRLRKALDTFEQIPAYKGAHKTHRHVSIEGIRIATWHQVRKQIGSYVLSFVTKSNQRLELPDAFVRQNPFLQDIREDELHPNDRYEMSKLFGDDTLRDLLVLTVQRQEANEANPLGKAFEQYMVNHANTYESNPHLKTLHRTLNLVHANIRETRPTFDWRVATFELVEAGVLELDIVQSVLGRPRNEATLTDLRTMLTSEQFTQGLSKRLLRRLSRSSILVGDNPDFWKTTRADVNLEHTGELHRIDERYPFIVKSSEYKQEK